jgi:hypothetical protein
MIVASLVLLASLAQQPSAGSTCTEWHQCRELALAAADRGDYELFHDLAWRAVQTGPPRDSTLMLLLARAQALSGRPHDALVMLQRLADMGVASDAETNPDFSHTRELPGWPEVAARIARVTNPNAPAPVASPRAPASRATAAPSASAAAPPPATAPAAPGAPAPAPAAAATSAPAPAAEAVRFPTSSFTLGGLAYDAVSERFVFADRIGRKLIVVSKGSDHASDFVRAESAGFHQVSAVEIDARRGDLWVASSIPADGAGSLHKLQLVSGRPLKSFTAGEDLGPVNFVDLAVTAAGAVLVLDAASKQLLILRPGGAALERVVPIEAEDLASVAAGEDENIAYVAHRDGISRVDLRAKAVARLGAPKTISLDHVERIRWTRRALIAVKVGDDGSRHVVRLDVNGSGRAVTKETALELPVAASTPTFVTVSGDDLYVADGSSGAAYRLHLR